MTNISDPNYPLTDPVEVTVITNGPDTSPVLTTNEKTPVVVSTKANPATNQQTLDGVAYNTLSFLYQFCKLHNLYYFLI